MQLSKGNAQAASPGNWYVQFTSSLAQVEPEPVEGRRLPRGGWRSNVPSVMTTLLKAHVALVEAERRSALYRGWGAAHNMGATYGAALADLGMTFGAGDTERLRVYLAETTKKRVTLTDAVNKAPTGLLEPFEKALLKLGEETGSLDKSLRLLADWYMGKHRLLLKLWSGSAYPLFLTLATAVLLPLPMVFKNQTKEYLIIAGLGVAAWWLFGGNVVYIAATFGSKRSKWVRARLARSLATAMEAGAPMDRVLDLAVAAAANAELEACVKKVPPAKRRAQPLSDTLRGCPHVPAELASAIQVAESTGNWSGTVGRLGELYEDGF